MSLIIDSNYIQPIIISEQFYTVYSVISVWRSNQLSYKPMFVEVIGLEPTWNQLLFQLLIRERRYTSMNYSEESLTRENNKTDSNRNFQIFTSDVLPIKLYSRFLEETKYLLMIAIRICGGGGTRTPATVIGRPNSLANCPRHRLGYASMLLSRWRDSNSRSLDPKSSMITGLHYT